MMRLMISPKDVAIAAAYFAAKGTGTQILDSRIGAPWWEQLRGMPGFDCESRGVMNEFYMENPLRNDNPYEQSPASFGNEEDLDGTRGRGDVGSIGETPRQGDRAQSQRSQNGHSQQYGDVENSTLVTSGLGYVV